ncbi:MAG: hypothetical protein LBD48_00550 [Treponema sp.]|nr:hypothetical protein [Treponema sp.]
MKKVLLLLMALLIAAGFGFAMDFGIRPQGFVFFPGGAGNVSLNGYERYGTGGGGALGLEADFSSIWPNPLGLGYSAGIEGAFHYNPLDIASEGSVQLYSLGGALGLYYFPLSRLFTRLDGALGGFSAIADAGKSSPGFWWRAGGETGFRFTPSVIVTANVGWREYLSGGGVFNSGLYTGLGVHYSFRTKTNSGREGVEAALTQDGAVFPAFLSLYQRNSAGTITIRNNENAEVRDVRVSFRAGNYTASEFPCGTLPLIARGAITELPLYADFSREILHFTGPAGFLGEIVIRYRFLGSEREVVKTVTLQSHNRNAFTGVDPAGLASFVSPNAPETLEFSKFILGLERKEHRAGLNQNMQSAVWLFEGLRAAGIRMDSRHSTDGEVQFPAETMGFKTGNSVDMGLLYAAALEAAGISCAIIPLENDFITAIYLDVNKTAAELLFSSLDRALLVDGGTWLPLSMNAFNSGFMAAWDGGVAALNAAFAAGAATYFILLEKAWNVYPPAPLPAQSVQGIRAADDVIARETNLVIQRYINQELVPKTQEIQKQAAATPTADLYNRLGILFVRTGRIAEARAAYERAAGMGLTAAMTNRGNLALIEKDYAAAERWFRQALARDKENKAALSGIEKIDGRRRN